MKIKDLSKLLQLLDPESEVLTARDEEGNGFNRAEAVTIGVYQDMEYYELGWTADECCLEPAEWEEMKKGQRCMVIWP